MQGWIQVMILNLRTIGMICSEELPNQLHDSTSVVSHPFMKNSRRLDFSIGWLEKSFIVLEKIPRLKPKTLSLSSFAI